MSRKVLGRGLSGMIPQGKKHIEPTVAAEPDTGLVEIPIGRICSSRWQPRTAFNDEKLAALADSIKEQGLVQPIIVRKLGESEFELIAGERRLRAVTSLGWELVKACIVDASDTRMRELALVENLQRDDLNAIEVASAYELLQREDGLTHEQIAQRLGVSRASITNFLRLLKLPEEIKQMVAGGELSAGHARTILGVEDPLTMLQLAKRVVRDQIPVQEVESIVRRMKNPPAPGGREKAPQKDEAHHDRHIHDIEQRLRSHLGVKVRVRDDGGKGTIEIEYYSPADVARLLERLGMSGKAEGDLMSGWEADLAGD